MKEKRGTVDYTGYSGLIPVYWHGSYTGISWVAEANLAHVDVDLTGDPESTPPVPWEKLYLDQKALTRRIGKERNEVYQKLEDIQALKDEITALKATRETIQTLMEAYRARWKERAGRIREAIAILDHYRDMYRTGLHTEFKLEGIQEAIDTLKGKGKT